MAATTAWMPEGQRGQRDLTGGRGPGDPDQHAGADHQAERGVDQVRHEVDLAAARGDGVEHAAGRVRCTRRRTSRRGRRPASPWRRRVPWRPRAGTSSGGGTRRRSSTPASTAQPAALAVPEHHRRDEDRRGRGPGHDRADDRGEPQQLHVPREQRRAGPRPTIPGCGTPPRAPGSPRSAPRASPGPPSARCWWSAARPAAPGPAALRRSGAASARPARSAPGRAPVGRGTAPRPARTCAPGRSTPPTRPSLDRCRHLSDHHAGRQHERDRQEAEHHVEHGEADHQPRTGGGQQPGDAERGRTAVRYQERSMSGAGRTAPSHRVGARPR